MEPYIEKCLNSIVNQTYKNIEILSYGKNKGVSFARNYGLLNSKGGYIYFIDSDDFIDYIVNR